MSFTGDILTATTPARLLCQRGMWVLELVRFVPVERNVFQPRTQRLEGNDAILQHLKRGENAALLAATQQMMRGSRSDEEQAFEAHDGDWIPRTADDRHGANSGAAGNTREADELAELRAELLILRASHERLRERVTRLQTQAQPVIDFGRNAPELAGLESIAWQKRGEAERLPNPQPVLGSHCADGSAGQSLPPESTPRAEARIKFPSLAALNTCLRALIGDKVTVKDKKLTAFVPLPGDRYWISRLIDDDGIEAGMIVADVVATASLGGMLMMLPDQEIDAQARGRNPSEDAIEAMSEVCNNLSAAFNQVPDAIRVRVKPIEPMGEDALGWLSTAVHKLQLEVTGGLGNLFLFSR